MNQEDGTATFDIEVKKGKEVIFQDSYSKELQGFKVPTKPAYVEVRSGLTMSPIPFESIRVDVGITIPCAVKDIDAVRDAASEWVYDGLINEMSKYKDYTQAKS